MLLLMIVVDRDRPAADVHPRHADAQPLRSSPTFIGRIRWQSHWHVIRQSWTFFQNDFAGRIANKVMQGGDAIEIGGQPASSTRPGTRSVFVVVAIVVMARLDWVLLVPIAIWLLLYGVLFVVVMPLHRQALGGSCRRRGR